MRSLIVVGICLVGIFGMGFLLSKLESSAPEPLGAGWELVSLRYSKWNPKIVSVSAEKGRLDVDIAVPIDKLVSFEGFLDEVAKLAGIEIKKEESDE